MLDEETEQPIDSGQRSLRTLFALSAVMLLTLFGCDSTDAVDAGSVDASGPVDASTDASVDASPPVDANLLDAGRPCTEVLPSNANELAAAFLSLWGLDDLDDRRCLVDALWAVDGEYVSSVGTFRGREELLAHLASLTPATRTLTSGAPVHNDGLRFAWSSPGGGSGIDLGRLDDDGRLRRVVSYSGAATTLTELGPYETYVQAWNEPDPVAREALLAASWAEGGVYVDPTAVGTGRSDLSSIIQSYLNQFAGQAVVVHEIGPRFGNFYWAVWSIRNRADDTDLVLGMDFCELNAEGTQIESLFSFFGDVTEVGFGGNRGDCFSCFARQLSGGDPARLCTTGTPTSVEIDQAFNICVCTTACPAVCGDNLCMGMPPTAECGACIGDPGGVLEACPAETEQCWADG